MKKDTKGSPSVSFFCLKRPVHAGSGPLCKKKNLFLFGTFRNNAYICSRKLL